MNKELSPTVLDKQNTIVLVGTLLYWLWPIDLLPGLPYDDIVVILGGTAIMLVHAFKRIIERIRLSK